MVSKETFGFSFFSYFKMLFSLIPWRTCGERDVIFCPCQVAVKSLSLVNISSAQRDMLYDEINIYLPLSHPNIVRKRKITNMKRFAPLTGSLGRGIRRTGGENYISNGSVYRG